MRCLTCGRTRTEHRLGVLAGASCNSLSTFRYDPHIRECYRALCQNCGQTGQTHGGLGGCDDFVPQPWDERRCRHCGHCAFYHRDRFCAAPSADCLCDKFEPAPEGRTPHHLDGYETPAKQLQKMPRIKRFVLPDDLDLRSVVLPLDAHKDCRYVGRCVPHMLNSSVPVCDVGI